MRNIAPDLSGWVSKLLHRDGSEIGISYSSGKKHREEKIMKRWKFSLAMVGLATSLVLARVHADNHHERACSDKTLNGSYGFYRTGTTSTGPLAAVGIFSFDGNGNVSGSQSISRNGVFTFDVPILGPYEVSCGLHCQVLD